MIAERAEAPVSWRLGYRPALDGVRALAIAGVFLVHLHEDVFTLGGYGVDVFFVLSGFLITLLLLQEHAGEGRIGFAKFYARRALRLLPVLYSALAVVLIYTLLTKSGDSRSDGLYDVAFGAVYLKNWEGLFHTTAASGPLVHLWSLSLEEQFYLVWPPCLAFLLARRWLRGARIVALVGFAILAGTRLFAFADPTTLAGQRADALLLGCAVAMSVFLFRTDRGDGDGADGSTRWAAPASLAGLLILVGALILPAPWRYTEFVQRGGITLVAIAAAALIVGVVLAPTSIAARALAVKPLVFVGRISYGLYVWHLIVFKLMPPKLLPHNVILADVMLVAVSFGVAVASFFVIERPALAFKARLRVGSEAGPDTEGVPVAEGGLGVASRVASRLRREDGTATRAEWIAVAAVSMVGGAVLWWSTGPRGAGLTSDGVAYLSTAENIVAGRGFGSWLQMPLASWPLGYPVVLASLAKVTGLSVLTAGRLLAAGVAVATGAAVWFLARRTVRQPALRVSVVVAVVFAAAMSGVQDKLLSDGFFTLGAVLLLLALLRVIESGSAKWLAIAVAVTWMMFLMRYAGIGAGVVGAGLIVVFPMSRPLRRRLGLAAGYAVGAMVVPALYLLRNASVAGSYLGQDRSVGEHGGVSGLKDLPGVFADWGFGKPVGGALALFGAVVAGVLVTAAVVLIVRSFRGDARSADELTVLGAYWLGLLVFLMLLRLVVFYDLDGRTLDLLFPLGLVFAAGLVGRVRAEQVAAGAAAVFVVWTVVVSVLGVRALADVRTRGSGYRDRSYDATYDELRAQDLHSLLPAGCDLRTNQPNVLYLAGIEASSTPRVGVDEPGSPARPPCIVWFDPLAASTDGLVPLDEVTRSLHLVPGYRGATFTVYVPAGAAGQSS